MLYVYIFITIGNQIIKRGRVVIQSNCFTAQQICVRNLTLSVPMKIIMDTSRAHEIRYLRLY
jgi:hypothetical protein